MKVERNSLLDRWSRKYSVYLKEEHAFKMGYFKALSVMRDLIDIKAHAGGGLPYSYDVEELFTDVYDTTVAPKQQEIKAK